MNVKRPSRSPRAQHDALKDLATVVPGFVILVLGFGIFAILYPKGGEPLPAPTASPATPAKPPSGSASASINIPSSLVVDPSQWPTQADAMRFGKVSTSEAATAPQPAGAPEMREVSCPTCGGKGAYVVNGKDETCTRCSGAGRCRMSVGGQN